MAFRSAAGLVKRDWPGSPPKCWAVLFLVIATLANITFAGPDPMMDSVEAALNRLGVSLANIESERYNFI